MVSTLLAPLYNWVFIYGCGLGLDGAAFANDAIFATTVALLGGYVVWCVGPLCIRIRSRSPTAVFFRPARCHA